jgi:hypothetical protein
MQRLLVAEVVVDVESTSTWGECCCEEGVDDRSEMLPSIGYNQQVKRAR